MKSNIKTENYKPKVHESYSPEEIFAAGGTTLFAIKTGKTGEALAKAMKNAPKIDPFTNEEWEAIVTQLENDK